MTDLSSLTADQLAEKVRRNPSLAWSGKDWHADRELHDAAVAELVRRLKTAEDAQARAIGVLVDYSEGRIDALVALGKVAIALNVLGSPDPNHTT